MITLSLEPFKYCRRLQPLRARHVLCVSLASPLYSLDNDNFDGLVRAEFETTRKWARLLMPCSRSLAHREAMNSNPPHFYSSRACNTLGYISPGMTFCILDPCAARGPS